MRWSIPNFRKTHTFWWIRLVLKNFRSHFHTFLWSPRNGSVWIQFWKINWCENGMSQDELNASGYKLNLIPLLFSFFSSDPCKCETTIMALVSLLSATGSSWVLNPGDSVTPLKPTLYWVTISMFLKLIFRFLIIIDRIIVK